MSARDVECWKIPLARENAAVATEIVCGERGLADRRWRESSNSQPGYAVTKEGRSRKIPHTNDTPIGWDLNFDEKTSSVVMWPGEGDGM